MLFFQPSEIHFIFTHIRPKDVQIETVFAGVALLIESLVKFPDILWACRSVEGRIPLTQVREVPSWANVLWRLRDEQNTYYMYVKDKDKKIR